LRQERSRVPLDLGDKTVGNYLINLIQKLHVTRRTQAPMYSIQRLPNK
jgi:DNA-binding NarL/FixJ family response regulator